MSVRQRLGHLAPLAPPDQPAQQVLRVQLALVELIPRLLGLPAHLVPLGLPVLLDQPEYKAQQELPALQALLGLPVHKARKV